jgi:Golgi phosphoprotein 3 (GPP34)
MLIAEDLLLLLYGDESGKPVLASTELDYALAGAVLLELAMLGRIDVAGTGETVRSGRLVVRDPSPTGSAILDERLTTPGTSMRSGSRWTARCGSAPSPTSAPPR